MEWPSGITIRIVEPGLSLRVSVNSLLSKAPGPPRGRVVDYWPGPAGARHGRMRTPRPAHRSAWRPGHRTATEHMRVHVPDGLPAVLAGVEDDPVPTGLDALGDRDLACRADEFVKQPAARGGEGRHVREMVSRHHQDVRWRLGVDVTEGDGPLSVQHYRGRDLSGRDPAEQAVWHPSIIVAARRARCRTAQRAVGGHQRLRLASLLDRPGRRRTGGSGVAQQMFPGD